MLTCAALAGLYALAPMERACTLVSEERGGTTERRGPALLPFLPRGYPATSLRIDIDPACTRLKMTYSGEGRPEVVHESAIPFEDETVEHGRGGGDIRHWQSLVTNGTSLIASSRVSARRSLRVGESLSYAEFWINKDQQGRLVVRYEGLRTTPLRFPYNYFEYRCVFP